MYRTNASSGTHTHTSLLPTYQVRPVVVVSFATSQTAKETSTGPPILRSLSGLLSAVHSHLRDTTNSTAQIADVEVQLRKCW